MAVGGGVALVGGWSASLLRVDLEEGEIVDLLAVAADSLEGRKVRYTMHD